MQSFIAMHFSVFKIQIATNGFAGPKRFQGFREAGLWCLYKHNMRMVFSDL